MPIPYSNDLRARVIEAVNNGMKIEKAVEVYKISKTAIYDWLKRKREVGSFEPLSPKNAGRKPTLTDEELDNIKNKIIEQPDITLQELKDELNLKIKKPTLCIIINKKLKLKYKKNSKCFRTKQD